MAPIRYSILKPVSLKEWSSRAANLAELECAICVGRFVSIRPPGKLDCRAPILSTQREDADLFFPRGKHNRPRHEIPLSEARLDCIPHARLVGQHFAVVSRDGMGFSESYWSENNLLDQVYFSRQELRTTLGDGQRKPHIVYREPSATRHLEAMSLLIGNPWCMNYHHWMINCLGRIWIAQQFPELQEVPMIVPARLRCFQEDSLDALRIAPQRRLNFAGDNWMIQKLLFPTNGDFWPESLRWTRAAFHQHYGVTEARGTRRWYVSRADAKGRRVVNEKEVMSRLERRGFEMLQLENTRLSEQVARFADAQVVVGPHGAGLTNLIFSGPDTTLVELHPADEVNHVFWVLANALGQRYAFMSGSVVNRDRDLVVSVPHLDALLDRILP